VLGSEQTYAFNTNDYVLISIANSAVREKVYNHLKGKVSFLTFISPQAIVGKFNDIEEGTIICPNAIVTTNVKLGKCSIVNIGSQIGHDVQVGDFTSLMANVDIGGCCTIGKRCFLGTNSTIIPERKIADDITIGAGAIVLRNFSRGDNTLYGNPAKKI
jgi:sugar O-acyltransferase (sialic acid O-acetyltransferase NeuD family)